MKQILLTICIMALAPCMGLAAWGPQGCATVVAKEKIAAPHAKPAACKCEPCKCKAPCKCPKAAGDLKGFFFGMDASQLRKDGACRYSINGKSCQKHEALAAVQLADDSAKPFVTFIGTNLELGLKFLETAEAKKCRVNLYRPDDWHVTGGFVTTGSPTVYIQNGKGEVLYRGDNPPIEVVQAEARKAQPDYDAAKDPNGSPAVTDYIAPVFAYVKAHSSQLVIVGLVALVCLVIKRS